MKNRKKMVRDFIYVDVERLYSLYSQVFEGVADQIIQSYVDGVLSRDFQKGPILQGSSIEAQVAEVSRRTENKFLYDHMYNRLEASINEAILEPEALSSENYRTVLKQASVIKVRGSAEIEDYKRIRVFLEKFNSLAEAIAYSSAVSEESKAGIRDLENSIRGLRDRNKRARASEQLRRLKEPKHLAREMGLSQDEKLLSNLGLFTEMFYPDGFEITIIDERGSGNVVFRGVLDKRWLRVQPDMLRALYGGFVESKWTMVGQLTYVPGVESPEVNGGLTIQTTKEGEKEIPSMRDSFRNMFRACRVFEAIFLESKQRVEVLLCPLSIYREIEVPVSSKTEGSGGDDDKGT